MSPMVDDFDLQWQGQFPRTDVGRFDVPSSWGEQSIPDFPISLPENRFIPDIPGSLSQSPGPEDHWPDDSYLAVQVPDEILYGTPQERWASMAEASNQFLIDYAAQNPGAIPQSIQEFADYVREEEVIEHIGGIAQEWERSAFVLDSVNPEGQPSVSVYGQDVPLPSMDDNAAAQEPFREWHEAETERQNLMEIEDAIREIRPEPELPRDTSFLNFVNDINMKSHEDIQEVIHSPMNPP